MLATQIVLAALLYSLGGYFMKLSGGLKFAGPTLMVFVLITIGVVLQAQAMRHEQLTVIYLLVLGLEAVAAFVLGVVFLDEASSIIKIGGVGLILVGIALLRLDVG